MLGFLVKSQDDPEAKYYCLRWEITRIGNVSKEMIVRATMCNPGNGMQSKTSFRRRGADSPENESGTIDVI